MRRIPFFLFFGLQLFFPNFFAYSQYDFADRVTRQVILANRLQHAFEGFNRKISGADIQYHSTRQDCANALLVRATDGKNPIVWTTEPIRYDSPNDTITLFFIAGMSLQGYNLKGLEPGFSVRLNGQSYFHFYNKNGEEWQVEGRDHSRMEFHTFKKDQYGDAFGYALIHLKAGTLPAGQPVQMQIQGDASGSQHWFMIFQCVDGLQWFKKKAATDNWFNLSVVRDSNYWQLDITTPLLSDQQLIAIKLADQQQLPFTRQPDAEGMIRYTAQLSREQNAKPPALQFKTSSGWESRIIKLNQPVNTSDLLSDRLVWYRAEKPVERKWTLQVQHITSTIAEDLNDISSSLLAKGTIQIFVSSHQDIAWMNSPEACIEDRDKLLITPALNKLHKLPDYKIDMEDILMLREYLNRHPDKKQEILELSRSGRLEWGASYNMPYEDMYFGEPLIRQFYLGKKWFEKEFQNCYSSIYWNVDVPARTLQMPQILKKSGVPYMIISRHERGLFYWMAPDGSKVLTYSPGHYYNDYTRLKAGFFKTVQYLDGLTQFWQRYYNRQTLNPVMPVLSDADMALPDSYFEYIEKWNSLTKPSRPLPKLEHSTALRFLQDAQATGASFPAIRGERPDVWLYIHGPSHFEALKAGRSAGRLLPEAEKLASMAAVLDQDWSAYPQKQLTRAWEAAIYPDHGWGGKNGEITDQTFLDTFRYAAETAQKIINRSAQKIAGRIAYKKSGIPLVLFNSLSWMRSDPVQVTVSLPDHTYKGIRLADGQGNKIAFQVTKRELYYPSGYLKRVGIEFIADHVPPLGYKTFYIYKGPSKGYTVYPIGGVQKVIENDFYKIRFNSGGMFSLFDKELGKEIWTQDQFRAGELFSMHSEGNGAGEFADIQQPDMQGFERLKDLLDDWKVIEYGPVRLVVTGITNMTHNRVKITWILYQTIKRIDVTAELIDWDGTPYREFRLAFPADMNQPGISYEVPFGVLRVGKDELPGPAGERYHTPCTEVHPRGIGNWINASDADIGVTISSPVAVWDYLNPTGLSTHATLLQPVLLASRKSCHGEGPLYDQTGNHQMTFSVFTHEPGWKYGYRQAIQANEPLVVVFNPQRLKSLFPPEYSMIHVAGTAIVSTVKKAEDNDDLILRFYDPEGVNREIGFTFPFHVISAWSTNLLEEIQKPVSLEDNRLVWPLGHHAIETIRLKVIK